MLLDISGVRPPQADGLARATLGAEARAHDVRRGRALVRYLLARAARDGHTVMPLATVEAALGGFEAGDPVAVVAAALGDGRVVSFDEEPMLALARYAMAEDAIAEGLSRLTSTAAPLCAPEDCAQFVGSLDDEQAEAVRGVAAHGVSVLTGGPGTGKSRTV